MSINKISIDRMLDEYKVNILTSTKVTGITEEGVKVKMRTAVLRSFLRRR